MKKVEILKFQIRSAKNVGNVWISRKKNPPDPLGGHPRPFSPWTGKCKNYTKLHIFLGGPMGPYSPSVGPCCYPPEVDDGGGITQGDDTLKITNLILVSVNT